VRGPSRSDWNEGYLWRFPLRRTGRALLGKPSVRECGTCSPTSRRRLQANARR